MKRVFESKLFPKMNNFLRRLGIVLYELVDQKIISEDQVEFILCFYDEKQNGMKVTEIIGSYPSQFSLAKIFQETRSSCKNEIRMIAMFPWQGNCVGIYSKFNDPKFDQAIVVLWTDVTNYIIDNPEMEQNDDFYSKIVEEVKKTERSFIVRNNYIERLALRIKNANIREFAFS